MAKKYGYKPKAQSLRGLDARTLLEMLSNPMIRLFRVPFGRHEGETRWARNVPWAGITTGATSTSEAIARIRTVNPKVAANCERFASGASRERGTVQFRYNDGVVCTMPMASASRASPSTGSIVGVIRAR